MTLIVGVLCEDGVVIGSDSSATFTDGGRHTVEQKTKKVTIIDDDKIMCGAGEVALSQRFAQVINRFWEQPEISQKSNIDIGVALFQSAFQDFRNTNSGFHQFAACLAFFHNDDFHLCEFPINTGLPEFKSKDLWYVSMGSGQYIADPFLGFVRKIFWDDKQPNLSDGIFGTIWTLNHAINVNPGGIGAPVQIGILDNKTKSVKLLSDDELQEHLKII